MESWDIRMKNNSNIKKCMGCKFWLYFENEKEKNAASKGVGIILNMFHIPWRKVMKLIEIWEKLDKQPLYITQRYMVYGAIN